jgi:hypothetical protein
MFVYYTEAYHGSGWGGGAMGDFSDGYSLGPKTTENFSNSVCPTILLKPIILP